MTRNLKAFGLGLVAAMALGGTGAQGASAVVEHSFRSAADDTVWTGQVESYGNSENKSIEVFTATAGLTVECYATLEGRNAGTIRDTVTVHPKFNSCTGGGSIHTTGCNYILHSDTTQASGHSASSEHAAVTIECENSHWIEVTTPGCNITTGPQTVHGVRFTNVTHSSRSALTFQSTSKTITYTATAGSFCGLAGHGAGTYTNGQLNTNVELTGYDASNSVGSTTNGFTWQHGAQTDIWISTPI